VVVLIFDQQFGTLEVPGADPHVEVLLRQVELAETPVQDLQGFGLVVDGEVVGLDVAVHDAQGVAVMESFEHLVEVVFAI
jgi:hypothetical protein